MRYIGISYNIESVACSRPSLNSAKGPSFCCEKYNLSGRGLVVNKIVHILYQEGNAFVLHSYSISRRQRLCVAFIFYIKKATPLCCIHILYQEGNAFVLHSYSISRRQRLCVAFIFYIKKATPLCCIHILYQEGNAFVLQF